MMPRFSAAVRDYVTLTREERGLDYLRTNDLLQCTSQFTFLGTLLGIGLAFAVEIYDARVRSERDLSEALGMPVLGVIPSASRRRAQRRGLFRIKRPVSA